MQNYTLQLHPTRQEQPLLWEPLDLYLNNFINSSRYFLRLLKSVYP